MSEAKTDLLFAARVLKSNGTDGEVILGFRDIDPEEINLKEPLYIHFDGLAVPFFIEYFSVNGNRAYVRLTNVRNLKDAEELVGRDIFIKKDSLEQDPENSDGLTIEDLQGWTVLNDDSAVVGTISGWEDIPGNPCIYLIPANGTESSEVMLPFHEDLILAIDEAGRRITMHIPEGLI